MSKVLIIAEAGVNHNGSVELALSLIDEAAAAGADIVKFQTFKTENLVTQSAQLADYQKSNGVKEESQFEMLKKLELTANEYQQLILRCKEKNIEFLSTAFDFDSLDYLVNELALTKLKIPSGEITNAPLVLAHARVGCPLIVSTGMCDIEDIRRALSVIAFGLMQSQGIWLDRMPCEQSFDDAANSSQGKRLLKQYVSLLHCTTEYPAPFESINLNAMDTMANYFSLPIGYSDHSDGISVPIAAVAKGANIIEKHFTIDNKLPGPDHAASLEPHELACMVKSIRQIEKALGSAEKKPAAIEQKNKQIARKSLVAATDIMAGESFNNTNLTIKRPGNGMSPYKYWQLQSKVARKSYLAGELINE